ncbi:pectin lyase fold/virulence factor [Xylariaceae sp. FL0804]|nr:pectin lyase fold/virulence factor [Xylariaceae sp. FL0804]
MFKSAFYLLTLCALAAALQPPVDHDVDPRDPPQHHRRACPRHGTVVFRNETYHIKSVMSTTGLRNVDIEHRGTLLWDQNNPFWLSHSLPVNVRWKGLGYGTLDGNGQITITGTKDSIFDGIRFVQSRMWTMTVIHSLNILLENIYVNSTDSNRALGFDFSSFNTDGADMIYSDNITFRGWTVDNCDDSISAKANSTNILMEDCRLHTGLGIALGSTGQYRARAGTRAPWLTTRPTAAAGGSGPRRQNLTFADFRLRDASGVFAVTQCTSDVVADLQCSAASPCVGVVIEDMAGIVDTASGTRPSQYLCGSVVDPTVFNCTGPPWGENNR